MPYQIKDLPIGENPYIYANHNYPGYKAVHSTMGKERTIVEAEANKQLKNGKSILILKDANGWYWLFARSR